MPDHRSQHPWKPLIGTWRTEATHRLLPGDDIRGRATFEWLDDQQFLLVRWHYDHPKIPDALAIIGNIDDEPTMHYFDVRGVHKVFEVGMTPGTWWFRNQAPGFSQRYTGTFSDDGNTIEGVNELSTDGSTWEADAPVTYRRVAEES